MSVPNKLSPASLDWALSHLILEGDGDLFPVPFEIEIVKQQWAALKPQIENTDISNHVWAPMRRVLVPRDEFSFRRACQLDPVDALLFSAIIFEIGPLIETRRRSEAERKVFSYRFSPDITTGALFSKPNPWEQFWQEAKQRAGRYAYAITLDVTDYYNQIYHHTVENQLSASNVPAPHRKAILNLLKAATDGVSRGIPVGPHASHVLAELNLIPLDDYLSVLGIPYIRYVDDIHVYCSSPREGQNLIFAVADYLDKTQKLSLNNQKTRCLPSVEYGAHVDTMLLDNPINAAEESILRVIRRRGGGYTRVSINTLTEQELRDCGQENIEGILNEYLHAGDPNYTRLRWFLRRLAQLGVPGGVDFVLDHLDELFPAIGDVASYLNAASLHYAGGWPEAGTTIQLALEDPIVEKSDYLQIVLLSLFARITALNHLSFLIQAYEHYSPAAKRKVLSATAHSPEATPWLQSQKAHFGNMDPWLRRAFLYATQQLPKDERQFWYKNVLATLTPLEKAIVDAVKNI